MENLRNKWSLITGASSGFGVQFAKLLAARKSNLVLAARRTEPMERLAAELRQKHGVNIAIETFDLARPGAGTEIKLRLDTRGVSIDILVNNAGYGWYGSFIDQPLDTITNMLQLNVTTLTELTHLFAADMVERRTGHILLIASLLGYQAVPGYAVYAATKAYVLLLGEALHQELEPHGVAVTALCPGPSATSFAEVAGARSSPLLKMMTMDPHTVAEAGIRAMLERRATMVPGFLNKAIVFLDRLMPRPMQRTIFGKVTAG
jgi:short-subunit dehydrogenase